MYVQINEYTAVSLESVCNVNILKDKQILNLCYTYTNKNNIMSGYYYFDLDNIGYRNSKYFKKNFIEIKGDDRHIFINKTKISFIKKEHDKIVIGFSHSVLRHNADNIIFCPEYMYIKMPKDQINDTFNLLTNA